MLVLLLLLLSASHAGTPGDPHAHDGCPEGEGVVVRQEHRAAALVEGQQSSGGQDRRVRQCQ